MKIFAHPSMVLFLFVLLWLPLSSGAQQQIWDEPFASNANGWYQDERMAVRDGRYEFLIRTNATYSWRSSQWTPSKTGRPAAGLAAS